MRHGTANTATPSRCCGLGLTATTLVALVAMTATAAGSPAPGRAEMLGRNAETIVVRAVAAAVTAVARDLAGSERSTMAADRLVQAVAGRLDPASSVLPRSPCEVSPVVAVPDERLIDRPPPRS